MKVLIFFKELLLSAFSGIGLRIFSIRDGKVKKTININRNNKTTILKSKLKGNVSISGNKNLEIKESELLVDD